MYKDESKTKEFFECFFNEHPEYSVYITALLYVDEHPEEELHWVEV